MVQPSESGVGDRKTKTMGRRDCRAVKNLSHGAVWLRVGWLVVQRMVRDALVAYTSGEVVCEASHQKET
ncbi:hypothetical protein L2E82_50593 [Cichorium intybus]|nr:hypothetical protein L2E82_50593 [Cichorium intybus]